MYIFPGCRDYLFLFLPNLRLKHFLHQLVKYSIKITCKVGGSI